MYIYVCIYMYIYMLNVSGVQVGHMATITTRSHLEDISNARPRFILLRLSYS